MTLTLSPDMFHAAFREEFGADKERKSEQLFADFRDDRRWTNYMLDADDGLLFRVMQRLSSELEYRREWYTIDALYVSGENLHGRKGAYPSELQALIEHENGENIEEEMWKLLHWRSPLKILIFYDWSQEAKTRAESKRLWLPDKMDTLERMRRAIGQFHAESADTAYLLLIGSWTDVGADIVWTRADL